MIKEACPASRCLMRQCEEGQTMIKAAWGGKRPPWGGYADA